MTSTHENFSREETVVAGSDRSFGLVMAAVLAALAVPSWGYGGRSWLWTGSAAVLFLAAALLVPIALKPLNLLWLRLGLFLHKVLNPVIMAVIFYGTVLPTGLFMRALGRDLLRFRLDPQADTYWIARQPSGPAPETMKDQF